MSKALKLFEPQNPKEIILLVGTIQNSKDITVKIQAANEQIVKTINPKDILHTA